MKKLFLIIILFASLNLNANHWNPNPYQYQNNMTVIGVISFDDDEQRTTSLELGAFCGDECRGSVMTHYEEIYDRYYVYLMIYGNNDDSITFRCYDHNLNMELDMSSESHVIFRTNNMIGSANEPFDFNFRYYRYYVTIDIMPEIAGTLSGDGEYKKNDTCYIEIKSNLGYQFEALMEDDDTLTKQQCYSFIVTSDRKLTAHFSEIPTYYQITAEATPMSGGVVEGSGQYLEGETCDLYITTNIGYIFEGLYENDTLVTNDTLYSFEVKADRHLIAQFLYIESLTEIKKDYFSIYPNPATDFIIINTEDVIMEDVKIYDMTGKLVAVRCLQPEDNRIDISEIPSGVYIVTYGRSRKLVVL